MRDSAAASRGGVDPNASDTDNREIRASSEAFGQCGPKTDACGANASLVI